ncbi:MAG: class I SAM-dependent methyltransferase [Gemmatimonadota bacterium]
MTAVSHSAAQGRFIRERAGERGLGERVRFVEADVSEFRPPPESFDRVVSVEMFEHLRDHGRLTARVARWLRPDGRLFVHVFSHRRYAYRFTGEGAGEWMGRHFFTGGLMPSHDLLPAAARGLELERDWWTDGRHYARTAEAWHGNLTASGEEAARVLARAGDPDPELAVRRWRIFFLAVAELFGYRDGREWGVSHYRFRPPGDPDAGASDGSENANTDGQP